MLRLIINKAKHHYNLAVEHAERNRYYQAVAELQNSLDLDKGNIAAHVLLGTIYAKQDKFDSAIEEWESALAISPNLHKAHQYIERAEKVKSALPVLKLMKILLASLFLSILCVFFLAFHVLRPHPSESLIAEAISEYQKNRLGSALEKTARFSVKYPSSAFSPLARLLDECVRKKMDEDKRQIQTRLHAGDYSGALEIWLEMESYHPDPETAQFLEYIRNDIKFFMKEAIEKRLAESSGSSRDIDYIKRQIDDFIRNFPDEPALDEYNLRLAALAEQDKKKELAKMRNQLDEILAIQAPETALSALVEFNRLYPDFASKAFVPRYIKEFEKTIYYNRFQKIQAFIIQNDYEAAEESLRKLSPDDIAEFPSLLHEYQNYKTLIEQNKSERQIKAARDYLKSLENAFQADNVSETLSLISQKDSYPLSETHVLRVQEIQDALREREAIQILDNIIHETSIHNLEDISQEEARKFLSDLERLEKVLMEDLLERHRERLLFLSCASYVKLGEDEQARIVFQNLLQEYPYSPLVPRAANILGQK